VNAVGYSRLDNANGFALTGAKAATSALALLALVGMGAALLRTRSRTWGQPPDDNARE
jgi:hypothetical protein